MYYTVCPRSSDSFYYSNLLNKMGHYTSWTFLHNVVHNHNFSDIMPDVKDFVPELGK